MLTKLKRLLPLGKPRHTDDGKAYKNEGDEHLKGGRTDAAAECYRRAVSVAPDYLDACVGLGFVLSEQQQYDEAERYLRHALSLDSGNVDVHYVLGTIANRRDDHAGAIEHFARALEIKPEFEFAHRDLVGALFRSGQYQKAREALQRALSVYPDLAEFHFYLGDVMSAEQDFDNAIPCYEKALSLEPGSAESLKHLADALNKRGHFDRAVAAYQKAIWFKPNYVDAHCGLGGAMQSHGSSDKAVEHYGRAVSLEPRNAFAQVGLGHALERLGRLDEATVCYRTALEHAPEMVVALQNLGNILFAQGAHQEAAALYERVIRLDPGSPVRHLVAALSGGKTDRAPDDYVEKLFDDYAQKFDSHLVTMLSYNVPERLVEVLRPHVESTGGQWSVLDLGCGTGLSGVAIGRHAGQLVGVDLSAKMLEKARERKIYHRLEQKDVLTMMQGEPESTFDVVIATDVFVYIGKLDELVSEVRRLLRPGGLFAFSVESQDALAGDAAARADGRGYQLNVTGRYAHSMAYLTRMAKREAFEVLHCTNIQVRVERERPVEGHLALWRSAAA